MVDLTSKAPIDGMQEGARVSFADTDVTETIKNEKGRVVGKRVSLSEFGRKLKRKEQGKLQNPIVPGAADYIQGLLYDRYTVAAAGTVPAQFQWFTLPIGQSSKTKADTNLTLTQQLPAPQWINVVGMGIYFSTLMIKPDIDTLLNTYWTELWVQDKIYLEGPFWMFPAPGGLVSSQVLNGTSLGANAQSTVYNNGSPTSFNFFDVRLPQGIDLGGVTTDGATGIIINGGQNFHVNGNGTSFSAGAAVSTYGGINVMCVLLGIISRQVQ